MVPFRKGRKASACLGIGGWGNVTKLCYSSCVCPWGHFLSFAWTELFFWSILWKSFFTTLFPTTRNPCKKFADCMLGKERKSGAGADLRSKGLWKPDCNFNWWVVDEERPHVAVRHRCSDCREDGTADRLCDKVAYCKGCGFWKIKQESEEYGDYANSYYQSAQPATKVHVGKRKRRIRVRKFVPGTHSHCQKVLHTRGQANLNEWTYGRINRPQYPLCA